MNYHRWGRVWPVALLMGLAGLCAARQTPADEWKPISPEELKMTSLAEAPGAPAVILYREVNRDDGRTAHEDNYVRIKIFSEEGRKYANVEIPYFRESGNVVGIKARSIRPDGSVVPFDGKPVDQTIVKVKGVKYLAKTFSLPDVQVGSIVEYKYTVDFIDRYVFDSKWILSDELFTRYAKFTLKANQDFALRWSWPLGLPPGTQPPKDDGRGNIVMEARNIEALTAEDYMPPETTLKYRVDFIYTEENSPEKDPTKFWKEYAKKQSGKLDEFANKKKAMEQAVEQTVASGDSPEVKLQKIYARVQQIRNTTFEKEKTDQELKREKQKDIGSVEDVWKRGYGDERQITWLFLGMARAAGFEASPVLMSQRNETFFNNGVMNPRELGGSAVQIVMNGKERYFDPGTAFTPFGEMPWWETMAPGLKLTKDGGAWVEAPLPESNDEPRIERKADLKCDSEGSLEGKLTVTYYGSEAQTLRMEERNEDDTSRKKLLEDMVKETVPAAIDVELSNQPDWKSSSPSLVTEYEFKVPGWVSGAGKRALLGVGLFSATEKGVFENAGRTHAVYFHFPYTTVDDVTIQLPLIWKVGSLARPVEQDSKAVAYVMKTQDQNGSVHLSRTLRCDLLMVPKENYPALRSFFQLVRTGDEEQVVLQPAGTSMGN